MPLVERINAFALRLAKGRKGPLARGTIGLLRGPYESFVRRAAKSGIETTMPDGSDRLHVHPDLYHWDFSGNEPVLYGLLKRSLKPGDVFFDVGAYIGHYSINAARQVGRTGRVFTFEPSETAFGYLLDHVSLNDVGDIVTANRVVIGDTDQDQVEFYVLSDALEASNSLALQREDLAARDLSPRSEQMNMRSIDSIVQESGVHPTVMKIDVEGAEVKVLRGARQTLTEWQPFIFCSIHPSRLLAMGDSIESFLEVVESLGYEVQDLEGEPKTSFDLEEVILRPK